MTPDLSFTIEPVDLVIGDVYRVKARNFEVGVCVGVDWVPWSPHPGKAIGLFLGVRQKFDYVYVTEEPAVALERYGTFRGDRANKTSVRRSLAQYQRRLPPDWVCSKCYRYVGETPVPDNMCPSCGTLLTNRRR